MSYRVERGDATSGRGGLNKNEMQQAKYGILRRAVSCDMTYLDRRDHYLNTYHNKLVCAPGFHIDRKSGGLSYKVGDYALAKLLGRGGGGSVYEGRHRKTQEPVAIKVVTKSRSEEARLATPNGRRNSSAEVYAKKILRTRKEYTAMSHLRGHRHIARLHDVIENDRAICLVMELGTDGDLFQLIQRKGRLSLEESWLIFRQLVSAVAHIHNQGFVHRDIKPENVVFKGNRAMLVDFGFADVWCSFKNLQEGVGSLNYCSPEIVGGLPYVGPEVDIWSLGTCLYAMVTGNLPFAADSPRQVVTNIKNSNFALSGCDSDPLLYNLLSKLLNPNALERATMADILQHRWFRNGPTLAYIKERSRKRTGSITSTQRARVH